jgi:hypothetical protein
LVLLEHQQAILQKLKVHACFQSHTYKHAKVEYITFTHHNVWQTAKYQEDFMIYFLKYCPSDWSTLLTPAKHVPELPKFEKKKSQPDS